MSVSFKLALSTWGLEDVISPLIGMLHGKGCTPPNGRIRRKGYIHPNGTVSKVNKYVESGCCVKSAETRIMGNAPIGGMNRSAHQRVVQ